MTAERWRQIEHLFSEAIEKSPEERATFLSEVCRGDEDLRSELESLLASDKPDERVISIPPIVGLLRDGEHGPDMTGRRIGPYRLTHMIGQGGMGAVYLGVRDDDQFKKQVAIKLLKRGMDTDFMVVRFRQERQILANLEHPFIARLLDGGATDDGLPYFVMEYVDGVPITKYCDEKRLSIRERLQLFRLVCEAVQHAHQNLVVHRDIKPGNILATKEGIPKLLDFGIAKVLDPYSPAGHTLTQRENRMLTPYYASPEQVKGLPISTAADIYSLGAVLYELLVGRPAHQFPSLAAGDIERTICEVDPVRPSLAVQQDDGRSPGLRKQLRRQLAGDLDNIILTAMRKEPERRYASAAELSEDLRRHLEARPVIAQEERWTYSAGKFIRRHTFGVAAVATIIVTLTAGIVMTTIQARRAERRFEIVRGLAKSMLYELHDEMENLPGSTALRASTIRTVVRHLDRLAEDGSRDDTLDLEIAQAYERAGSLEGHPFRSNLGNGAAALSSYRKAIALFERLADSPRVRVEALRGLIDAHLNARDVEALLGDPTAAASHLQKASAIADTFGSGGPEIPPSTQINVYFRLADSEYQRGSASGEVEFYRKALEVCQKWVSDAPGYEATRSLSDAYHQLGTANARSGDLYAARANLALAEKTSQDLLLQNRTREHSYNAISLQNAIGDLMGATDDPAFEDRAGALSHYRKAFAMAEELAEADPQNRNARRNLASCYRRLGMMHVDYEPAAGLGYYQKALAISEALNAGGALNIEYFYAVSRAHMGVGEALYNLRRYNDAIWNLKRGVELQTVIEGRSPDRIWNLRILSRTYSLLGSALLAQGDSGEAVQAFQDGLAAADRMLRRAPSSLYHQLDRADVLEAMGRSYLAMAARPGVSRSQRSALRQEARSCFARSLEIWQTWVSRKVGLPYAAQRATRAARTIASVRLR